jgi:hypothetical protein
MSGGRGYFDRISCPVIDYDPAASQLDATDVQAAIDLLARKGPVFVLDPTGVPKNNVFTTWTALYAHLPAAGPERNGLVIVVASDAVIPAVVPYDLRGIEIVGLRHPSNLFVAGPLLSLADGVVFSSLPASFENFYLEVNATVTAPYTGSCEVTIGFRNCTVYTNDNAAFCEFDGALGGSGAAYIRFSGAQPFDVAFARYGLGSTNGVFRAINGAYAEITLSENAYGDADTLTTDASAATFEVVVIGSASFFDTDQPNILGTLNKYYATQVANSGSGRRSNPSGFGGANPAMVPVATKGDYDLASGGVGGNDWGPLAEVGLSLLSEGRVTPSNGTFIPSGFMGNIPLTAGAVATDIDTDAGIYGEQATVAVIGAEEGWVTSLAAATRQGGGIWFFRFNLPSVSAVDSRTFVGLTDQVGALRSNCTTSDTPPGNYLGVQLFTSRGDTTFHFVSRTDPAGVEALVSIPLAAPTSIDKNGSFLLMLDLRDLGKFSQSAGFRLWRWPSGGFSSTLQSLPPLGQTDPVWRVTSSTFVPNPALVSAATPLGPAVSITTLAAVAKSIRTVSVVGWNGLGSEML